MATAIFPSGVLNAGSGPRKFLLPPAIPPDNLSISLLNLLLGYTEINPASGMLKKILPPKNKRNLSEPQTPSIGKTWESC
jgi:hypothetical protein